MNTPNCCADCKHCQYIPPQSDQPYPEFWCDEGEWEGIASTDELYAEIDCEMFESKIKTTEQIIQGMEKQVNSPEWKQLKENNNGSTKA